MKKLWLIRSVMLFLMLLLTTSCAGPIVKDSLGDFDNFNKIDYSSYGIMDPKFDDQAAYIKKFTEVFETADLNSITMVIMEVPCCGGMRMIVKEALKQAGRDIPVEEVVVSARGEIKD